MRFYPDPCDGLHPAFAERPAPMRSSTVAGVPALCGMVSGLLVTPIALLLKRTALPFQTAAYGMVGLGTISIVGEYRTRGSARRFLESKGIHVSQQKLVERLGELDVENFLLSGAALGVLVATFRRRPASASSFSYYTGAAAFGAFGAGILTDVVPWAQLGEAKARNKASIDRRTPAQLAEFFAFVNESVPTDSAKPPASGEPKSLSSTLQRMFRQGSSDVEEDEERQADEAERAQLREHVAEQELDKNDPRPHLSQLLDGERTFRPATNYKWDPGTDGEQLLKDHIDELQRQRQLLSREATQFWRDIAVKEALFYRTPIGTLEKDRLRAALELMNECHVNIWIQVSLLDWMIADSNKNLLQLEAMKEGQHWIPERSKDVDLILPKLTLKILHELRLRSADYLDDARMQRDIINEDTGPPPDGFIDPMTGLPAKNPERLFEDMKEMARQAAEDAEIKDQASQDLIDELLIRNDQPKR